jgi:Protein of unknown function (DUF3386)
VQQYKSETVSTEEVVSEPAAREMLKRAFEKTSRWPSSFKGFTADLTCQQKGRISEGSITVKSSREVTVRLDDEPMQKWAEGQIGMIAVHRGPRSFAESDGRYALALGPEDDHPMGRSLSIRGDGMNSYYRIKDDRITQINRSMERTRFTINIEDSLTTHDGKSLTTRYAVFYFEPSDGSLKQVETYSDSHAVVNGIYLPGTRRVSYNDNGEVVTRLLSFDHHRLL